MTRYAEAETAYGAILGMEPHNLQALAGRSGARRALGHQRAADEDLGLLLADSPPDAQGAGAQFHGLYLAHRYAQGLTLIRMQLAEPGIIASEADYLGLLEAVLECAMGDADAALRHAHALVAARPDDSGIHEIIAHASIQLGRSDAALSHAHRALAGAPRHPELLETLGIVERLSGHPELAYEALLDAAIARPQAAASARGAVGRVHPTRQARRGLGGHQRPTVVDGRRSVRELCPRVHPGRLRAIRRGQGTGRQGRRDSGPASARSRGSIRPWRRCMRRWRWSMLSRS